MKNNNIQKDININIINFNPQNINFGKTISDYCSYGNSYICDGICFFQKEMNIFYHILIINQNINLFYSMI